MPDSLQIKLVNFTYRQHSSQHCWSEVHELLSKMDAMKRTGGATDNSYINYFVLLIHLITHQGKKTDHLQAALSWLFCDDTDKPVLLWAFFPRCCCLIRTLLFRKMAKAIFHSPARWNSFNKDTMYLFKLPFKMLRTIKGQVLQIKKKQNFFFFRVIMFCPNNSFYFIIIH